MKAAKPRKPRRIRYGYCPCCGHPTRIPYVMSVAVCDFCTCAFVAAGVSTWLEDRKP